MLKFLFYGEYSFIISWINTAHLQGNCPEVLLIPAR